VLNLEGPFRVSELPSIGLFEKTNPLKRITDHQQNYSAWFNSQLTARITVREFLSLAEILKNNTKRISLVS